MTKYILAADIGGTKTDLGLFESVQGVLRAVRTSTVPTSTYGSAEGIIDAFLLADGPNVKAACLGVAGPVVDGEAVAPNIPWTFSEVYLSRALKIPNLRLINDLVATAYGIEALPADKFVAIQAGKPEPGGARALLAPGTGLGEAIIISEGDCHRAIATEGGHCDFGPSNEEQIELLQYLKNRGVEHVSWETLGSGPGLKTIFDFVVESGKSSSRLDILNLSHQENPSAAIAEAGTSGSDPACEKALNIYLSILGAEAGNLALKSLSTGGLYLCGGVPPKLLRQLSDGRFLSSFRAKGRMRHLMERIPVHVLIEPRTALLGAALCARLSIVQ